MSAEMVTLHSSPSHKNDNGDDGEEKKFNWNELCVDHAAILLGNIPTATNFERETKSFNNNDNNNNNGSNRDRSHHGNNSNDNGSMNNPKNNNDNTRDVSNKLKIGQNKTAKDCFAVVRETQLTLSEQWALEFAQMPFEEQKKLQHSLLPKRTKEQEEQRIRDREAAGLTPFRRLSFDFDPLEGDEVPRFAEKDERGKIELLDEKQTILSGDLIVVGRGKKRKLEQDRKRILTEQLGELTCDEKEQLQETKAFVHFDFYRNYIQIVSMFKPVLLICSLIFVYVHVVCLPWQRKRSPVVWAILFYNPLPSDSLSVEVVGSLFNGLLVLVFVVVATLMYVVLLFCKARNTLLRILQILNMLLLGGPTGYFIYQLLVVYSIRFDIVSFIGCIWNVVGVGWFALNYNGNSKTFLTRGFLILLAICMAWPFIEFPEPSVWATLGLLVVYDLFAVLAPCGPLRYIMEAEAKLKREGREAKPLPGLVYRGHYFIVGLGDLVFYGALMGQASVPGWATALGCLIGILMGVAGTILWTTSSGKLATPALPMSAVLGLFLRLVVPLLVLPMLQALGLHILFL